MNSELHALVDEATVDCYNDEEKVTGLFTMIHEHLALPRGAEWIEANRLWAKGFGR
ncbi:hypothetical protein [Pseudonocardia aurantiaca]|uniref:Uncharacterized protein n=1 Tax=Pseudonocardia aurantiaca TaxID=75290 RepID=A0ABW4FZ27_9PSEU